MKNDKRGMTLVEIMIVLLVTTILLSAVYFVLVRVTEMNASQQAYINGQDALRNSLLIIEKDIRRSSQSLEIKENDDCYEIKDSLKDTTLTYCLVDKTLKREGYIIADKIDGFSIENNDFYINLRIESQTSRKEMKYEKKIFLRTAPQ